MFSVHTLTLMFFCFEKVKGHIFFIQNVITFSLGLTLGGFFVSKMHRLLSVFTLVGARELLVPPTQLMNRGLPTCLHKRAHISFFSTTITDIWPCQRFARIMTACLEEFIFYDKCQRKTSTEQVLYKELQADRFTVQCSLKSSFYFLVQVGLSLWPSLYCCDKGSW